ncbi:MAG: hypothetical protein RDV41_08995 [Planctomycetota bacterium]|nr:hypothetical protein [Planctomycetota bacterium]
MSFKDTALLWLRKHAWHIAPILISGIIAGTACWYAYRSYDNQSTTNRLQTMDVVDDRILERLKRLEETCQSMEGQGVAERLAQLEQRVEDLEEKVEVLKEALEQIK